MNLDISIPKELLARIDFSNTVNGGMVERTAQAWKEKNGYKLMVDIKGIDCDKIQIQAANQRFMIFYMMDVLEGEAQLPYFLINLPLAPEVDIERIKAHFEDNFLYVFAPFNDWAKGITHQIDIEKI
ncbi:MAG: Hsp20/alpha crystallin family protein [Saprospiraceae bacterium]|nr:Hsp20/alpha crystallin family protein [Saprospiraceae bacterium]